MSAQRIVFPLSEEASGPADAARYARWFDEFRTMVGGRDITLDRDRPFAARVEYLGLDSVGVSRSVGSLVRVERRREHIARDGDTRLILVVNRSTGVSRATVGGRCAEVEPGSAALFDFAEPSVHEYSVDHRSLSLHLPRRLLRHAGVIAEDAPLTLRADNDALRILVSYGEALLDDGQLSDPGLLAQAGHSLVDLAVLAFGTGRDNSEIARLRGLRAARLAAVLRLIRTEYRDPELSPSALAASAGISTRYLHVLLHETGATFAERVQELRLTEAFSLLCRADGRMCKVSDAAYAAGFSDLSHFNRLFRRRYGLTPTAARGRLSE